MVQLIYSLQGNKYTHVTRKIPTSAICAIPIKVLSYSKNAVRDQAIHFSIVKYDMTDLTSYYVPFRGEEATTSTRSNYTFNF